MGNGMIPGVMIKTLLVLYKVWGAVQVVYNFVYTFEWNRGAFFVASGLGLAVLEKILWNPFWLKKEWKYSASGNFTFRTFNHLAYENRAILTLYGENAPFSSQNFF